MYARCVYAARREFFFCGNGHASAAKMLLRLPRSPKFITTSCYKPTYTYEGGREENVAYTTDDTLGRCFCFFYPRRIPLHHTRQRVSDRVKGTSKAMYLSRDFARSSSSKKKKSTHDGRRKSREEIKCRFIRHFYALASTIFSIGGEGRRYRVARRCSR